MASNQSSEYGPLPLVVGVTGHRDLREGDYPVLERKVREVFESLIRSYPHTPIILLSPLAEGSDRLAARVALQLEQMRLIVPLPMREELYRHDFTRPGSQDEFDQLLGQAEQSFVLPVLDGRPEEEISERGRARDLQYEQVGAYIARHSHILIALWDGLKTEMTAGTSKIVQFQQEGVPEPYAPHRTALDVVESGPVYHIVTPRNRAQYHIGGQAFTIRPLYPKGHATDFEVYHRIYMNMEAFNEDALSLKPVLEQEIEKSMNDLFPMEEAEKLPPMLRTLIARYAVADTLAVYFKELTKSTLNKLFMLVALAAVSFGIYAHLLGERHEILFFYLSIIALAHLLVYHRARKGKYQNKYQDYRTLAEGMRVQFFWCLASLSLKKFKLSVADHYLRKQKGELDWIRHAVRVWNIPDVIDGDRQHAAVDPERMRYLELLLKHWVCDQAKFFTRRAKEDQEKLERSERGSRILLWSGVGISIIFAVALLASSLLHYDFHESIADNHPMHGLLILLMTVPPVMAALLHSYTEKTALSEHVKQYSRMSGLFTNAEKQLSALLRPKHPRDARPSVEDVELARELIEELGKEALVENGDWVLIHRERPVDPPHAV
jgi:hypothetical protein